MPLTNQQFEKWLNQAHGHKRCVLIELNNSVEPVYLSTREYRSWPNDSLPNIPFDVRLTELPEIVSTDSLAEIGDFEFSWPEKMNDLISRYWRGRTYQMWLGSAEWCFDDFRLIAAGFIDDVRRVSRDRLRVEFADTGRLLEQSIQNTRVNVVTAPDVDVIPVVEPQPINTGYSHYYTGTSAGGGGYS